MEKMVFPDYDYDSDFNSIWTEILLTKGGLSDQEIHNLAAKLTPKFVEAKNWEASKVGSALMSDLSSRELLPELTELVTTNHPNKLTHEEAQKLYDSLKTLPESTLRKIAFQMSKAGWILNAQDRNSRTWLFIILSCLYEARLV